MDFKQGLIAMKQALVFSINFLGFTGIILIFYGILVYLTEEKYKYLETTAEFVSNIATLLGVALTASSVWLPKNAREPEQFSKFFSAPLVFFIAITILIFYLFPQILNWFTGLLKVNAPPKIPVHVFNGLAILGLAGGLFRTVSR